MERNVKTEWSLWDVDGIGTLLVTSDRIGHEDAVLISRAQHRLDGETLTAVTLGRNPTGFELAGDGSFPDVHGTALRNHLEVFGVDPDDLSATRRLDPKGVGYSPNEIPLLADVRAMGMC